MNGEQSSWYIDVLDTDLEAFGTGGGAKLSDDELTVVLRSLKAVLRRLGIGFDPRSATSQAFKGYWKSQDMSGSWGARQSYLHALFAPIFAGLDAIDAAEAAPMFRGVDGELKNIIFLSRQSDRNRRSFSRTRSTTLYGWPATPSTACSITRRSRRPA